MKKILKVFVAVAVVAPLVLSSCGGGASKEDKSATEKARLDSISAKSDSSGVSNLAELSIAEKLMSSTLITVDLLDSKTSIVVDEDAMTVQYKEGGKTKVAVFDLSSGVCFKKDFSGAIRKIKITTVLVASPVNSGSVEIKREPSAPNNPWIAGIVDYIRDGNTGSLKFIGIDDVRGDNAVPVPQAHPRGIMFDLLGDANGVNLWYINTHPTYNTYKAEWIAGTVASNYEHYPKFNPPAVPAAFASDNAAKEHYYANVFY